MRYRLAAIDAYSAEGFVFSEESDWYRISLDSGWNPYKMTDQDLASLTTRLSSSSMVLIEEEYSELNAAVEAVRRKYLKATATRGARRNLERRWNSLRWSERMDLIIRGYYPMVILSLVSRRDQLPSRKEVMDKTMELMRAIEVRRPEAFRELDGFIFEFLFH